MWWRVLTGVIAFTAVVAQIGQIMQIAAGKIQPLLKCRKDRTEAFAITTGITDPDRVAGILDKLFKLLHALLPPCLQYDQIRFQ